MAKSNDNEKELAKKGAPASKPPKAEKNAKAAKADKNKKPNIFVRMGRRLKETFSELKRVTWPKLPDALKATGVVLVIVLIFTVLVTGVNYGFSELLKLLSEAGA